MNIEEAISQLQAAQGDRDSLALATMAIVLASYEPELQHVLEAAAIPHWFDARILSVVLGIDQTNASRSVDKLQGLPMVESFVARHGWNVHEATRLAVRRRLAREEPERLQLLSTRAAKYFEADEPAWCVEAIYHRLVATPEEGADELERVLRKWNGAGHYEPMQALSIALGELLSDLKEIFRSWNREKGLKALLQKLRECRSYQILQRYKHPLLELETLAMELDETPPDPETIEQCIWTLLRNDGVPGAERLTLGLANQLRHTFSELAWLLEQFTDERAKSLPTASRRPIYLAAENLVANLPGKYRKRVFYIQDLAWRAVLLDKAGEFRRAGQARRADLRGSDGPRAWLESVHVVEPTRRRGGDRRKGIYRSG